MTDSIFPIQFHEFTNYELVMRINIELRFLIQSYELPLWNKSASLISLIRTL